MAATACLKGRFQTMNLLFCTLEMPCCRQNLLKWGTIYTFCLFASFKRRSPKIYQQFRSQCGFFVCNLKFTPFFLAFRAEQWRLCRLLTSCLCLLADVFKANAAFADRLSMFAINTQLFLCWLSTLTFSTRNRFRSYWHISALFVFFPKNIWEVYCTSYIRGESKPCLSGT